MEEKLDQAMVIMKNKGFKNTKRRVEILTFLIRENRYVGAVEVFDYMNSLYSGISYDTIYRNLKDFSLMGVLEETELMGEKKYRFHCDVSACDHHHHHFICTGCGATKEIHLCPMDFFKEQLPGCQIEGHRFEILGKCEKCLKNIV